MMNRMKDIYSKLISINETEKLILTMDGVMTPEMQEHINAMKAEARCQIRKELRRLPGDPIAKSLLNGSKRTCSDGDVGYYEFWYETDDPTMTDEEVAEYVDSEYSWSSQYPGGAFTVAYFKRTQYGLRIVTRTSLDI